MEHERIIQIYDYLCRYTNEDKGVTIKEIQRFLSSNGNTKDVSAITIRRDIDRLTSMGNDIQKENSAHNTSVYKLLNKGFNFNEIRFIVDSISINKFLSDSQKQSIIKKFEGMCSEKEIRQLISRISLNGRSVPSSNLLENLEKVHKIISEKRKINFEYGKYDVHKDVKYYSKKREIIPCRVVYFDERFYLKCFNEETDSGRTYRIDRMKNIVAGDKVKKIPEAKKYDGAVIDMFEPDYYEYVTFRLKKFLLDDMLEKFGKENINTREDIEKPDCVMVRVKIGINGSFYRWVMKYGSNIEIVSPENVRNGFIEELKKVSDIYKK